MAIMTCVTWQAFHSHHHLSLSPLLRSGDEKLIYGIEMMVDPKIEISLGEQYQMHFNPILVWLVLN